MLSLPTSPGHSLSTHKARLSLPPGDRVGYPVRRGGMWRLRGEERYALTHVFTHTRTSSFHACSPSHQMQALPGH